MKILQLCKKFPFPLKDGESVAVHYLSKALHEIEAELSLLVMNTTKHYFNLEELPSDYKHYKAIETVDIDNRLKAKDAFLNLFSKQSYHISRFISNEFKSKLVHLLQTESFDVVQLETLFLAPYLPIIRENFKGLVVMRSHNVEFEIWERVIVNTKVGPKKWYLKLLTKRLKRFEIGQLNHYDLLLAITERDAAHYKRLGMTIPWHHCPIGLDASKYHPAPIKQETTLCISFIGSLDWMPNLEGLVWFLEAAWPKIITAFPNTELHIAGRHCPNWFYEKKWKNVIIHGEVENARDFINTCPIMVVPLLSGSGMRVKILEGMALGRTILSTSIGMEGIAANNKQEILIADDEDAFLDQLRYCYTQQEEIQKIGQAARKLIEEKYDNQEIARKLLAEYKKLSALS